MTITPSSENLIALDNRLRKHLSNFPAIGEKACIRCFVAKLESF
jgi:hypothetical protein